MKLAGSVRRGRVYRIAVTIVAAAAVLLLPLPFFGATRVVKIITIAMPPARVFDYVTTPDQWPQWHPSSIAVRGATRRSAMPGEQISEEFVVAGIHGTVLWTVVQRQAPQRWVIEGDVAGGGRGTITYTLSADTSGTRFEREFVYPIPNLLLALVDGFYLRTRIEAESAQALARLKHVLERER